MNLDTTLKTTSLHTLTAARGLSRRKFLTLSLTAAASCLIPSHVFAAMEGATRLRFFHTHTAEKLDIYHVLGQCSSSISQKLEHFLRDFRTSQTHAIDTCLLDSLSVIAKLSGRDARYEVISGYRSPKTNRMLQKTSSGVASHSLHMEGRAIDVRLTGFATSKLHKIALASHDGGVGYYPRSDFIHLDTGRKRSW